MRIQIALLENDRAKLATFTIDSSSNDAELHNVYKFLVKTLTEWVDYWNKYRKGNFILYNHNISKPK